MKFDPIHWIHNQSFCFVFKPTSFVRIGVVVKVHWSDSTMVCSRVVLGRVVGQIVFSWFPEDVELALGGAVLEPIEAHGDGFATFLLNCSCEDSTGGNIVSF